MKWQPVPIFLPGKFHRQKSLEGYSPWGCEESDMTDQLSMHTQLGSLNTKLIHGKENTR